MFPNGTTVGKFMTQVSTADITFRAYLQEDQLLHLQDRNIMSCYLDVRCNAKAFQPVQDGDDSVDVSSVDMKQVCFLCVALAWLAY